MTPTLRRAALGVLILASLALSACVVTKPAKVIAGAATGAVKGAVGAVF